MNKILALILGAFLSSLAFGNCEEARKESIYIKPDSFVAIAECMTVLRDPIRSLEDFGSERGPTVKMIKGCVYSAEFEYQDKAMMGVSTEGLDSEGRYTLLGGVGFTAGNKVIGFKENKNEIVMFNKARNQQIGQRPSDFDDSYVYNKKKKQLTIINRIRESGTRKWNTTTALILGCKSL